MPVIVKERFFFRIYITAAVEAEAKLLEILSIAGDVRGDIVSAGLAAALVAGEERIMGIAEDILVRAVRAHIPPPARAGRIDYPEARMVRSNDGNVITLFLAVQFRFIRIHINQIPATGFCRSKANFENVAGGAAFAVAVPEAMNLVFRRTAFMPESGPEIDIPCRYVFRALHRPFKSQLHGGILSSFGNFHSPKQRADTD